MKFSARMAKLVDAPDLKSVASRRVGSSPTAGTTFHPYVVDKSDIETFRRMQFFKIYDSLSTAQRNTFEEKFANVRLPGLTLVQMIKNEEF